MDEDLVKEIIELNIFLETDFKKEILAGCDRIMNSPDLEELFKVEAIFVDKCNKEYHFFEFELLDKKQELSPDDFSLLIKRLNVQVDMRLALLKENDFAGVEYPDREDPEYEDKLYWFLKSFILDTYKAYFFQPLKNWILNRYIADRLKEEPAPNENKPGSKVEDLLKPLYSGNENESVIDKKSFDILVLFFTEWTTTNNLPNVPADLMIRIKGKNPDFFRPIARLIIDFDLPCTEKGIGQVFNLHVKRNNRNEGFMTAGSFVFNIKEEKKYLKSHLFLSTLPGST